MDREQIYALIIAKDTKNVYTATQLSDAVDEVEQAILNYCAISTVPDALRFTVVNMSIDLLRYNIKQNSTTPQDALDVSQVSSVKIGDTTISVRGDDKGGNRVSQVLMNYTSQLNHFRRIW